MDYFFLFHWPEKSKSWLTMLTTGVNDPAAHHIGIFVNLLMVYIHMTDNLWSGIQEVLKVKIVWSLLIYKSFKWEVMIWFYRIISRELFCTRFVQIMYMYVKFIYSKNATKFCEIFPSLLTVCTVVKSKGKILWPSQNIWTLSTYLEMVLRIITL